MIKENNIEELIEKLCPNGVEFKELGDISEISNIGVDKKVIDGQKPVLLLNYMDVYRNKRIKKETLTMQVTASDKKFDECEIKKGDIFITPTSETIDDIGHSSVADENIPNGVYSYHIMRIRLFEENLTTSYFISYLFDTEIIQKQIDKFAVGITRYGVTKNKFAKFQIPIPPLAIQQKIVNILDNFTQLETELEMELEMRSKQYKYYLNQLLMVNNKGLKANGVGAVWKTLGEVCLSISAGGDLPENYIKGQKTPSNKYPYPIFANATDINGLYGYTDNYKIESDAVTISARGAKVGYHAIREGKFTPIIRLITLIANRKIITTKFLNYILDITSIVGTEGGIPQLTVPTVKKINIPIPSLAEQERIVAILDKFDKLVNSKTEGLPAEIAARRKQYEYYRGKLLDFKALTN
ncbi:MAG: restriction endonuclease subunit S [Lutibacter sp.]